MVLVGVIGIAQTAYSLPWTTIATIPVGKAPFGIAYDSVRGEMFVVNNGANTVSVISDTTNTVVATITVGKYPFLIAYDSGKGEMFVTNWIDGTVSVINDATRTVVATIKVEDYPGGGIAYDSVRGEMFVVNYGRGSGNTVSVISDETNSIVATIPVGKAPFGIAYDSVRGEMFVTNSDDNTVSVISDATRTVVATIPVSRGDMGIAYNSAKGEIYIGKADKTISVISDTTNAVVATIKVDAQPLGIAYDSGKGEIFVTVEDYQIYNNVYVIRNDPDTIPPVVIPPQNITVNLNSTSIIPTPVTFSFTATDNVGVVTQSCTPISGSAFSVGVTTITCTATDSAGNIGKASFTVTVNKFIPTPIDTDGDGISDSSDSCPTQPETLNGYQDTDGCPDFKLNPLGKLSIDEGKPLSFTAKVTDTSLSGLVFSLDKNPPLGAKINSNNGMFAWTPSDSQGAKSYVFDIVVTLGSLTDRQSITITVNDVLNTPKPNTVLGPEDCTSDQVWQNNACVDSTYADAATVEMVKGSGVNTSCADKCYTPSTVQIKIGGTVTWKNVDTTAHTVTSGTHTDGSNGVFDSSVVFPGSSFEWTPTTEGEFTYFDVMHPWMTGKILVGGGTYNPSTDTDGDGILDSNDKCPTQAETVNGYQDTDGCPDVNEKKALEDKKVADTKKIADAKKAEDKKAADAKKAMADKEIAAKKASDAKALDAKKAAEKKLAEKKAEKIKLAKEKAKERAKEKAKSKK